MRKLRILKSLHVITAFVLLSVLVGCNNHNANPGETEYFIYYLNNEEDQLVKESVRLITNNLEEQLEVLLSNLSKDPKNVMYKKVIKESVNIQEYSLINNKLTLYFDASYSQLTGIGEVLCRAAIVKTLCQLSGVDYVEFIVGDQPLKTRKDKLVGLMSEKDFIDNMTGESIYRQNMNLSMYFANNKGNQLVEVPITILFDGTIPLEQMVIQQLIQGPEAIVGIEEGKLKPTLPKGVKLNQVSVKDRVAFVDFNGEFVMAASDVKSEVVLYSVVNALVELPTVDKVQFLVDGNVVEKYGDVDISVQLERNLDIVRQSKE